jgi:hypothetical protein
MFHKPGRSTESHGPDGTSEALRLSFHMYLWSASNLLSAGPGGWGTRTVETSPSTTLSAHPGSSRKQPPSHKYICLSELAGLQRAQQVITSLCNNRHPGVGGDQAEQTEGTAVPGIALWGSDRSLRSSASSHCPCAPRCTSCLSLPKPSPGQSKLLPTPARDCRLAPHKASMAVLSHSTWV